MTVHNSRFSLDERVLTFVDTKHSIYTLLPSSALQLSCLRYQRQAYRLYTSHTIHIHPGHRSSKFHCDAYLHHQTYKWTYCKKNLNTSWCIIIAELFGLAVSFPLFNLCQKKSHDWTPVTSLIYLADSRSLLSQLWGQHLVLGHSHFLRHISTEHRTNIQKHTNASRYITHPTNVPTPNNGMYTLNRSAQSL